ncbi:fatty acid metabolism transcriptional regulator FadR [Vibrio sp. SS-MA-C1-2]|uniref:fatty acid metabolism transcriptional regulator FadR n=1 Tax=Vibrio sp. SS-MA-C1-2 TaxID=2908646 RepID=UPI001F279F33|nr:fatty acid metabolism transcriptional regulator FadR [Vibrio sp. SS-MA-C1-2]UJF19847.1 fatty acid metabolism transcriptional regulator FadR [Vibrio sp. SS-MA-C1-2]
MVIKANSPATFAEKYIIESIWNDHFPQGSILPAERELSELIGVTRTTLREVLQRLSRDGWLTIQHGKPTRVNDFMHTSGLNILDTLITLKGQDVTSVLEDLLVARTDISSIYMRHAIQRHSEDAAITINDVISACEELTASSSFSDFIQQRPEKLDLLQEVKKITEQYKDNPELCEKICLAKAFNYYDYLLFQGLAFNSGNKVYVLTINGMRKIYSRIGSYYFMLPEARKLAMQFYRDMATLCNNNDFTNVPALLRQYGRASAVIWDENKEQITKYILDED